MEINFAQLICILHTDAKTLSFTPLWHWHLRQNYLNRTFLSASLIFQMSPPSQCYSYRYCSIDKEAEVQKQLRNTTKSTANKAALDSNRNFCLGSSIKPLTTRLELCLEGGDVLKQGLANLFWIKGQRVNIFSFVGHMISVSITQLYCCHVKAAINDIETDRYGCVSIKLHLQKQENGLA